MSAHGAAPVSLIRCFRYSGRKRAANPRFIISETSDHDPYNGGAVFVPYDKLVDTCVYLLAPERAEERQAISARGYAAISQRPFWREIRDALAATGQVAIPSSMAE